MPYVFASNKELSAIAPDKIARASAERVGFQIMPMRDVPAAIIQWTQRDNTFGLQQLRGLDGAPSVVKPVGEKAFSYTPGVYGEFETVTETELTTRAGSSSDDVPIAVNDLILTRQDQLITRELDRIESIIWTLLTTGSFSITLPGGSVGYSDTFALQTFTASPTWATVATAVPLADFRAVQLLGAGKGVTFGSGATAYMNRITANSMLGNTNAADLAGKRQANGATFNSVSDINRILLDQDIPNVVVYDEGYYDATNTFVRFVPNNKVVVVGKRAAGERIGEYVKTLNANNPNRAPGSYSFTVDRANGTNGEKRVPPNIEVHQGHNGGPIIYYPNSVVIMTV